MSLGDNGKEKQCCFLEEDNRGRNGEKRKKKQGTMWKSV